MELGFGRRGVREHASGCSTATCRPCVTTGLAAVRVRLPAGELAGAITRLKEQL